MLRDFVLGPRVAEHATAFVRDPGTAPATPRRAATVALVRDGDEGAETYLLRRVATMAFAARMHVFPGGGVDPRDSDERVPWAGPTVEDWALVLGVGAADAAGLVCAAVRELFEECGVLLAGPGPDAVVGDLSAEQWEDDRLALLDRSLALSQLLERRGLVLRSDLLRAWSRWCTPAFEPRRYDTWFFVARLPQGQLARDVGGEADHAAWVPVRAAVEGHERGDVALMPPTVVTLEELAACPDVDTVLGADRTVQQVMPWLATTGQDVVIRVDVDGRGGGRPGPASGLERSAGDGG